MKRTLLATIVLMLFTLPMAAEELRLEVDLSTRLLAAYVGRDIVQEYRVAVGKDKNPTPVGTFKIRKVVWNPSWKPPEEKWAKGKAATPPGHPDNPMKAVKFFFQEPDYYIHGTDAVESLGKAESHGCIRMDPGEATMLAKLVMEHGGKPQPDPWYRRIFRRRTTKVIQLAQPVVMQVRE